MASISYSINGKKELKNIYVRIVDKSIDLKARTNFVVYEKNWSKKKGTIINPKNAHDKILQSKLASFKLDLLNAYHQNKELVNLDWVKNYINPKSELNKDMNYYFNLYTINKIDKTKYSYSNSNKKLNLFLGSKKKKTISPSQIDANFLNDFYEYLTKKENYSLNNAHRNIVFLKTILFFSEFHGENISKQVRGVKFSTENKKPIVLSFTELDKIKELQLTGHLANARDWLIISCYTGQRISDFLRFEKSILKQEKGKWFVEFVQKKTKKKMFLPLHKEVVSILERTDFNFPRKISDQRYNGYIKEVCKIAELNELIEGSKMVDLRRLKGMYPKHELISSHIGRRSFATNFYGIIPTNLIMTATGHSTENMLLTYIGKTDRQQAYALSEYF